MNNPTSYTTGKLIEECWEMGWDIVFAGPTSAHPNGWIYAEKLDNSDRRVIVDTVVIPYEEVNRLIEIFMGEVSE